MYFKDLGYDTYDKFLDGVEWKEIRDIFFYSGVKYRCRICHLRGPLVVHKRTYYYLVPEAFRQMNYQLLNEILVYLCHRCNQKVHFYTEKDKVPLDYLFLWNREKMLYWSLDNILRRVYRDLRGFFSWIRETYHITKKGRRKRY